MEELLVKNTYSPTLYHLPISLYRSTHNWLQTERRILPLIAVQVRHVLIIVLVFFLGVLVPECTCAVPVSPCVTSAVAQQIPLWPIGVNPFWSVGRRTRTVVAAQGWVSNGCSAILDGLVWE